jgi:predicted transcriptional regulator
LKLSLQQELSTGRFQDPNDVLETALHVLADSRPYDLAGLNAKIQEGLDDIERGDVFTEEEARAYIAAMRAKL